MAAGDGQPLLWGKDLERELIDYMEQKPGRVYRRGGLAKSDTVPAMLTPGEFVVNRQAVARYGAGFEAINNLSAPAQALAGRALAGIQGFASGGLVQPASRSLPTSLVARRAAHPHRARGTVLGTTEGQRHRRCARRSATAATAGRRSRPHGLTVRSCFSA